MSSTSLLSRRLRQASELGIGVSLIATLVLAGCGGGTTSSSTGTSSATVSTTDMTVTPMKGQFSAGTTVLVKLASDLSVVASGVVGASGTAVIKVPSNKTGPFLIEAGIEGNSYFDEASGASAEVPPGTVALRALIPDAASAVGVTALTEMAVGQIEAASGIKAAKATDVIAANATIGSQFGVTDPLTPPTVIGQSTAKITGGNTADDYALKLAGIAKMAASGVPALKALHDLRDDIADGKLDGQIGTTAITSLKVTAPTAGQTYKDAMNTALNAQVTAATTAYAAPGATAPTVTLTVQDLKALLSAAIEIGKKNQSAASLHSEVKALAQNVAASVSAGSTTETAALQTAQATAAQTTDRYTLADLAGNWSRHRLQTGVTTWDPVTNAITGLNAKWSYGQETYTATGTATPFTDVISDGSPANTTPFGITLTSDGTFGNSDLLSLHGTVSKNKQLIVATATAGNGNPRLIFFQKQGGTFTSADFAGTWDRHIIRAGRTDSAGNNLSNRWEHGVESWDASGNATEVGNEVWNIGTPNATDGFKYSPFTIASDGTVTVAADKTVHGTMSLSKDLVIVTKTAGNGLDQMLVVFQKRVSGVTYSLADLKGTWARYVFRAGRTRQNGTHTNKWEYGLETWDANGGAFEMVGTTPVTSDGSNALSGYDPAVGYSVFSISSNGTVTHAAGNAHGTMSADKNLVVLTRTAGNGIDPVMVVFVRR